MSLIAGHTRFWKPPGDGLPLFSILNFLELRAVLAHQFAHFYGGDTALDCASSDSLAKQQLSWLEDSVRQGVGTRYMLRCTLCLVNAYRVESGPGEIVPSRVLIPDLSKSASD